MNAQSIKHWRHESRRSERATTVKLAQTSTPRTDTTPYRTRRETPAVSSSANSDNAVCECSSASRTLRETEARATSYAESEETENRGTCPFRSFAMRLQPQ